VSHKARVQAELYDLLVGWMQTSPPTGGRSAAPEVTASVISSTIFGAGFQWSRDAEVVSAEEVADQALSVNVGGLQLYSFLSLIHRSA
jgi:hypothetical protein